MCVREKGAVFIDYFIDSWPIYALEILLLIFTVTLNIHQNIIYFQWPTILKKKSLMMSMKEVCVQIYAILMFWYGAGRKKNKEKELKWKKKKNPEKKSN